MNIRIASTNEYDEIRMFYHALIDGMKGAEYKPGWEKGVYPSDDDLRESLANGALWVYETEDGYAAVMIFNHECNDGYKTVSWSVEAEDSRVFVIHALGVMPNCQGKGIAAAMVQKAIEIAKKANAAALRLDVLEGNIPAEKLYIKRGFQYVDTIQMFYEDTGWTNFKLYEYILGAMS